MTTLEAIKAITTAWRSANTRGIYTTEYIAVEEALTAAESAARTDDERAGRMREALETLIGDCDKCPTYSTGGVGGQTMQASMSRMMIRGLPVMCVEKAREALEVIKQPTNVDAFEQDNAKNIVIGEVRETTMLEAIKAVRKASSMCGPRNSIDVLQGMDDAIASAESAAKAEGEAFNRAREAWNTRALMWGGTIVSRAEVMDPHAAAIDDYFKEAK